jgi:hypothetical protein
MWFVVKFSGDSAKTLGAVPPCRNLIDLLCALSAPLCFIILDYCNQIMVCTFLVKFHGALAEAGLSGRTKKRKQACYAPFVRTLIIFVPLFYFLYQYPSKTFFAIYNRYIRFIFFNNFISLFQ